MPEIPDSADQLPFNPTSQRSGNIASEQLVDWARRGFALTGPEAAKVVAYFDARLQPLQAAAVDLLEAHDSLEYGYDMNEHWKDIRRAGGG